MVICLERVADLHMSQLMPLPLTVSCFSKIQIGFTFLVPSDLLNGCVCVRVCVCGISWTTCKQYAPCSRQITILEPHHSIFTGRMLFLMPKQMRQSTEGNKTVNDTEHSDEGNDEESEMAREQCHEDDTRHQRQQQAVDSTRHRHHLHYHLQQSNRRLSRATCLQCRIHTARANSHVASGIVN